MDLLFAKALIVPYRLNYTYSSITDTIWYIQSVQAVLIAAIDCWLKSSKWVSELSYGDFVMLFQYEFLKYHIWKFHIWNMYGHLEIKTYLE